MKQKIDIKERLLYLLILVSPLLDILSYWFTKWELTYTPSTFLRPVITLVVLLIIFIQDSRARKWLIISAFVFIGYLVGHIYIFKQIMTDWSFGGPIHEAQYVFNYTYLTLTLIAYIYVFYRKSNILNEIVLKALYIYIGIIVLSIITQTSGTTYIEGTGLKGWFNTGGQIGSILVLGLFIVAPIIFKQSNRNRLMTLTLILVIIIYLALVLGTRVGLIGVIAFIFSVFVAYIIPAFLNRKKRLNKKEMIILVAGLALVVTGTIGLGSATLNRRRQLNDLEDGQVHIAYDINDVIEGEIAHEFPDDYIPPDVFKALVMMRDKADEIKLSNVDVRMQQLYYHYYLFMIQNNPMIKIFGNGFVTPMGALNLEMEIVSTLFNFGILGLLLFFIPFLGIFIYGIYLGVKNIRFINFKYIIYGAGILLSYLIAILAGHVYFNTAVMPMIIVLHVLFINEAKSLLEAKA